MPRDSAGNYNLVAGNPVQSGEVISSSWANNTLDDVALALTDSLDRNGRGGMLAPFRFADGTNLLPGASWVNETTTGFYRFDGGDLRVAVLTQDVMRWQTSGVQIWDATDMQWDNVLTDGGGGSQVPVNVGTADGQTLRWEADNSAWEATSDLVVSDAGNVGIATATPERILSIFKNAAGGVGPEILLRNNSGDQTVDSSCRVSFVPNAQDLTTFPRYSYIEGVSEGAGNPTALAFGTNLVGAAPTERMRIDSEGNVGIGNTAPPVSLSVGDNNTLGWSPFASTGALFNGVDAVNNYSVSLVSSSLGTASLIFGNENTQSLGAIEYDTPKNEVRVGATAPAGEVAFIAGGGVERMRINSAGNVGIGTTVANYKLSLSDNTIADGISVPMLTMGSEQGGSSGFHAAMGFEKTSNADGELLFYTKTSGGLVERMRIDSAGNVGIGTTAPNTLLTISGATTTPYTSTGATFLPAATGGFLSMVTGGQGAYIGSANSGSGFSPHTVFGRSTNISSYVEHMRIDSSGNLLVNRTAVFAGVNANAVQVQAANAAIAAYRTTATGTQSVINNYSDVGGTGVLTGYSRAQGDWFQASDSRRKHAVRDIEYDLSTVLAMRPVHFKWNGGDDDQIGFIAQEAMEVVPESVSMDDEGFYGMGYANLVPVLVKAIQEQQAQIDELRALIGA